MRHTITRGLVIGEFSKSRTMTYSRLTQAQMLLNSLIDLTTVHIWTGPETDPDAERLVSYQRAPMLRLAPDQLFCYIGDGLICLNRDFGRARIAPLR